MKKNPGSPYTHSCQEGHLHGPSCPHPAQGASRVWGVETDPGQTPLDGQEPPEGDASCRNSRKNRVLMEPHMTGGPRTDATPTAKAHQRRMQAEPEHRRVSATGAWGRAQTPLLRAHVCLCRPRRETARWLSTLSGSQMLPSSLFNSTNAKVLAKLRGSTQRHRGGAEARHRLGDGVRGAGETGRCPQ